MDNKKLERKLFNLEKQLAKIQSHIERLQLIEEAIEQDIYMLESELTETIPNNSEDEEKSEDEK